MWSFTCWHFIWVLCPWKAGVVCEVVLHFMMFPLLFHVTWRVLQVPPLIPKPNIDPEHCRVSAQLDDNVNHLRNYCAHFFIWTYYSAKCKSLETCVIECPGCAGGWQYSSEGDAVADGRGVRPEGEKSVAEEEHQKPSTAAHQSHTWRHYQQVWRSCAHLLLAVLHPWVQSS